MSSASAAVPIDLTSGVFGRALREVHLPIRALPGQHIGAYRLRDGRGTACFVFSDVAPFDVVCRIVSTADLRQMVRDGISSGAFLQIRS